MRIILCKTPNPQVLALIGYLSITKAKKNPPSAKNISTDTSPACRSKTKGYFAISKMLWQLTKPIPVGVEKEWPITTHIIAIALTPSHKFRSQFYLTLKCSLMFVTASKDFSNLTGPSLLILQNLTVATKTKTDSRTRIAAVTQETQFSGARQLQFYELIEQIENDFEKIFKVEFKYLATS